MQGTPVSWLGPTPPDGPDMIGPAEEAYAVEPPMHGPRTAPHSSCH